MATRDTPDSNHPDALLAVGSIAVGPVRGMTYHRLWIKPHLEASHGTARGSDLTVIRNSGQPRASTRVCYERPDQVVYRYLRRWRQTRVWNRQLLKPVPDRPGPFVGHGPVQRRETDPRDAPRIRSVRLAKRASN